MVKRPDHSHCILLLFRTANGKKSFTNWLQSLKNDQKTTNSIFQKQSKFWELYELFVYRLINLCSISIKLSGLIKFFHVKTTPFPLDIFTFSPYRTIKLGRYLKNWPTRTRPTSVTWLSKLIWSMSVNPRILNCGTGKTPANAPDSICSFKFSIFAFILCTTY